MLRRVGATSPRARIVLLAIASVLVPGLVLGALGLGSITDRAEGLRVSYAVTATLVRDRLVAELGRVELDIGTEAGSRAAGAGASDDLSSWLTDLEARFPWIATSFFVHRDGGVLTARLTSGWPDPAAHPLVVAGPVGDLVRNAETVEFAEDGLSRAASLYEEAAGRATDPEGRCLALTRMGRTLFKAGRLDEGIAAYRAVAELGGRIPSVTGAPCDVVALYQISEGYDRLGRVAEGAEARLELLTRLLSDPWDLERQYRFYLENVVGTIDQDEQLGAEAVSLVAAAAEVEWIRRALAPRIPATGDPPRGTRSSTSRLTVVRDGEPHHFGYRILGDEVSRAGIVAFGYEVGGEGVADGVPRGLLESVEAGTDLRLGVLDERGRWRGDVASAPKVIRSETPLLIPADLALAEASLDPVLPGWRLALLDEEGRSIAQIVARENLLYAVLMSSLVLVLMAGIGFTVRAASHEVELSRLRSDFVANVTHELKTPLALIRMYGETLESGLVEDSADRLEFLAVIRRESERLTHLINNVLDLGEIDSGSKAYHFATEDLVSVVRDSIDAYRPFFDRAQIEVDIDVPRRTLHTWLDRDAMARTLINLLHNALKYGGEGGYVGVRVHAGEEEALVRIVDRGAGIPADQLSRIFDKYHRVQGQNGGKATGSGLGLAIVKHVVEAHGGRVEVESSPGVGSTFTLRIPLSAELPGQSGPGSSA